MTWKYQQSTGDIWLNGAYEGRGYSGHGQGVNNPAMQGVRMVGPIPQGLWNIGYPRTDEKLGPLAFPLTPAEGTDALDRSGFFIHGDNSLMNETGSEGCIVLGRSLRIEMASAYLHGDTTIEVIP